MGIINLKFKNHILRTVLIPVLIMWVTVQDTNSVSRQINTPDMGVGYGYWAGLGFGVSVRGSEVKNGKSYG